jgi:hypothetical protein
MLPRRRLLVAVAIAAIIALPAGVLAGLCVGNACRRQERAVGRVPFCSLPQDLRSLIAAGFRDGRSPHVLTVSSDLTDARPETVPLAFAGTGVASGVPVAPGTTLDAVAPTLAEVGEVRRPHPGVRSGEAVNGVASGEAPRLLLLIAWKGVSSRELERKPEQWPVLRGLFEDGAGTLEAAPGSLPLDPAALLATIGTGALPRDHGITGAFIRNDEGVVVEPWTPDAPFSVVSTLADDLDELGRQVPRIGLVGGATTDLGLVGGDWYVENDRDDVVIEGSLDEQAIAAEKLLGSGYGEDTTIDLLGVAMEGPIPRLDRALGRLLTAAGRVSDGSFTVALAGAPASVPEDRRRVYADELAGEMELQLGADVIEEAGPDGVFLDQDAMTRNDLTDDRVVAALRDLGDAQGERAFLDVFPAIAVTFARYC